MITPQAHSKGIAVVRGEAQFQRRTHDDNGGRASADIWLDAEGAHRLAKALDAVADCVDRPDPVLDSGTHYRN